MISELEIRNFRSIRNDRITLEPLTVLIGANGSGKSNLVKALEFISDLPNSGVQLAVSKQGGRDGLVPKVIPLNKIHQHLTYFKYRTRLNPPGKKINYPNSVDVTHEFELRLKTNGSVEINKEKLEFHKVLHVGKLLSDIHRSPKIERNSPESYDSESYFTLSYEDAVSKYEAKPEITDQTLNSYIYWLGLGDLKERITTPDELNNFLKTLKQGRSRRFTGESGSKFAKAKGLFVDPDTPTIIDFAPQAQYFYSKISSIKRYDFLLHELRREQVPSDSPRISKHGENLPTALRKLSLNKKSYTRLKASFETIAPYIFDMIPSSLRTGKEFIEFIESKNGRGIESWHSSDGSLRALAILVALETANPGQTVIIEEPEQNLHPWAVRTLIDHIREIVDENNTQIILTTHSEHVLERIKPREVRVVNRSTEEGTKFQRLDQILLNKELEIGEVGRLWVKGLLTGVPVA